MSLPMLDYKAGQVYKTTKPFTSIGFDAKERYFICLGRSSILDSPVYFFSCTTTTRFENYKDKKTICIEFEYSPTLFTQPCLICLDDLFDNMTISEFESYNPKLIGNINETKIKEIKEKLPKADLSPIIIKDIFASFLRDGF